MRNLLWTALLAPLFLWGSLANADEKDAENALREKIWAGYEKGWAVRTATTTSLESEGHRVYLVTLYAGNEYKFQAIGDKHAQNIDLVLHDSEGKEVQRDESTDREPKIVYKPTKTKTYYIAVYAAQITEDVESAGVALAVTYR